MYIVASGHITKAKGGDATGSHGTGGSGIYVGDVLTISGGEIQEATGGNGGKGGSGILSNNTVIIEGGTIQKATGGDGTERGGSGIHSDKILNISGKAFIQNAKGGTGGSGGGTGIRSKGQLTISENATITNATGGEATGSTGTGGSGIYSSFVNILGGIITKAKGGNATDTNSGDGGHGISSDEALTIHRGNIETAQGGTSTNGTGGNGIYSRRELKIDGGAAITNATGGASTDGTGGHGIRSGSLLTISDNATITNATGGSGRSGGHGLFGSVMKILSSTIGTAKGGEGKTSGGNGIYGVGKLTISDNAAITNATGGNAGNGNGGNGIYSDGKLTIENSTITNATGGTSTNGTGGDGIHSGSVVKISGDTITKATGGNATGKGGTGGSGIGGSFVNIAGGTINTTGGSGKSGGAGVSTESGIVSIGNSDTPLDLTATSPDADNAIQSRDGKKLDEIIHLEENGMLGLVKLVENGVTRLFHNGVYTKSIYPAVSETHPLGEWRTTKAPTCTEKGEKQRSCTVSGCVVTETEELPALGHQWSDWTPVEGGSREYRICAVCNAVEYRDVSHNSGSSDSTISTGLRVLDPAQADILQNTQLVRLSQINDVLYIDVALETASLQGVLSDLTGLRSENIETVVFSTERCTSTLSLSDVAALGAGDTPFTLSHSGSTASFTVGGADHSALLR